MNSSISALAARGGGRAVSARGPSWHTATSRNTRYVSDAEVLRECQHRAGTRERSVFGGTSRGALHAIQGERDKHKDTRINVALHLMLYARRLGDLRSPLGPVVAGAKVDRDRKASMLQVHVFREPGRGSLYVLNAFIR